jgi:hypothetical protein
MHHVEQLTNNKILNDYSGFLSEAYRNEVKANYGDVRGVQYHFFLAVANKYGGRDNIKEYKPAA